MAVEDLQIATCCRCSLVETAIKTLRDVLTSHCEGEEGGDDDN